MTGGLAQLGEHLLCKQGVVGSIPSSSTNTLLVAKRKYRREVDGCGICVWPSQDERKSSAVL